MAEMMRVMLNGENIGLEGDDKRDGCSRGRGIFQRLVKNIEDLIKWLEQSGFVTINNNHSRELSATALPTVHEYLQKSTNFTRDAATVSDTVVPKVRIIVDSVDKLIDAPAFGNVAEENYKTLAWVVRSLTKAIVRIYVDERFKDLVEIKAFLPMDLEPFLQDRAFEHEYIYHHHIHWNRKELAALVAKRIARTTKMSTLSGDYVEALDETWDELFPFSISNVETTVKHKSFDYLLRHSQYRPREILRCCRAMTEYARIEKKSFLTDKEYVNIIHEHCQREAKRIIDEYILAYPTLYDVLNKFRGSSNIIPSEELYSKLRKIRILPGPIKDHADLLQFLYDIGFLGIVVGSHEMNALGTCLPYTVYKGKNLYFAFKNFDPDRSVASVKTFVIHPIFYGRFAIKANPNITICHILGPS